MRRAPIAWILAVGLLASSLGACALPDTPTPSPPPDATFEATPSLLTRGEAIGLARAAAARSSASRGSGEEVLAADLRRYGELDAYVAPGATPPASADQLVWAVNLGTPGPMGQGVTVILDAIDGHVIQLFEWIA